LHFKEQVRFNFKNKTSAVQWEWNTSQLTQLTTPVSFRWTLPLSQAAQALQYWNKKSVNIFRAFRLQSKV
jgi:hypothetical protein